MDIDFARLDEKKLTIHEMENITLENVDKIVNRLKTLQNEV